MGPLGGRVQQALRLLAAALSSHRTLVTLDIGVNPLRPPEGTRSTIQILLYLYITILFFNYTATAH